MSWLTSPAPDLVGVAVKVTLIYGTALLGMRVGERRTLAQWTTIDFAAAVAIVGRTALAKDQSYAVGAVALVTIVTIVIIVAWPACCGSRHCSADFRTTASASWLCTASSGGASYA